MALFSLAIAPNPLRAMGSDLGAIYRWPTDRSVLSAPQKRVEDEE